MADRKRKRKSPASRSEPPRKATGTSSSPAPTSPAGHNNGNGDGGNDAMKRGYARAEAKNQAVRDSLEPLEPGERPGVVVATAVWCLVIAANMGYNAIFADVSAGGRIGNVILIGLVLVAIVGTLKLEYWAILGVQTILALAVIFGVLAAMVLPAGWLIPLVLAGALISGYLFLRMIKVMARVQKTALLERDAAAKR